MNDNLQVKFAITLIAATFFLLYAIPQLKELKRQHDQVIKMVGPTWEQESK